MNFDRLARKSNSMYFPISELMEKSSKSTLYLERLKELCVETYKATNNGLAPVFFLCRTHFIGIYMYIHIAYATRTRYHFLGGYKFNTIKYRKLSLRYELSSKYLE